MRWILVSFMLAASLIGFPQSGQNYDTTLLEFNLGYNIRATPIYLAQNFGNQLEPGKLTNTNAHDNLTGSSFTLAMRPYHRKWFVEFGYTARYDHISNGNILHPNTNRDVGFEENTFMHDVHINAGREVFRKDDFSIAVFAGYDLMNNGTEYSMMTEQVNGADTSLIRQSFNLHFLAFNAGFELKRKNLSLDINFYYTEGVANFIPGGPFILPEMRLRYTIASQTFKN